MAQVQLQAADAVGWFNWVRDFDRTFGLFQTTIAQARANANAVPASMRSEYNRLMSRGATLQAQMNSMKRTRDIVANWLQSVGRTVGNVVTGSMDWLRARFNLGCVTCDIEQDENNLGLAPVIWVGITLTAAIAGLVAAARWITETQQFNARMATLRSLVERGINPDDAARQVAQAAGDWSGAVNAHGVFGVPWIYVGIGAAALVLVPRLMRS